MKGNLGKIVRLACIFVAITPMWAQSACKDVTGPGLLWNYEGNIGGNDRIRMTLEIYGARAFGTYFHAGQLDGNEFRDFQLAGSVIDGKQITLDEIDPSGQVIGHLRGTFPDNGPRFPNRYVTCDVIEGVWEDAGQSRRFYVYRTDNSPGTLAHRYAIAGVADDETVNRSATLFWLAVTHGDRQTVASLVAYPLDARRLGDGTTHGPDAYFEVKSPEELLSNYDAIFSAAYVKLLSRGLPRDMSANEHGMALDVMSDLPPNYGGEFGAAAYAIFNSEGKVRKLAN